MEGQQYYNYMAHQINMMQKDAAITKQAIDNLMLLQQQDNAKINNLKKSVEEKTAENTKLDEMYKDIVVSLVEQVKIQQDDIANERKLNKSLKSTLQKFRGKSKKLCEQSYCMEKMRRTIDHQFDQIQKMKRFIKNTYDDLDDICYDAKKYM
ncbi:hypothetical protein [Mocis latipes granulovirus]|uniref:Uncharacterized protein n=1 Tax=Mocis latipes granulovirus TaxID=2072024 RepID=A0A161C748_9BBAC|nr:hypothetical protein [Mocis latipes granulovirus]AKR17495.1 hypothetical protein [Mocis latipes granulovirus]